MLAARAAGGNVAYLRGAQRRSERLRLQCYSLRRRERRHAGELAGLFRPVLHQDDYRRRGDKHPAREAADRL